VQEEGSLPGMQWRAPQAVCTSAARKIRVPLVARQRQSLSAGLVSLLRAERIDVFVVVLGGALRAEADLQRAEENGKSAMGER
jgi:hypothetical protein